MISIEVYRMRIGLHYSRHDKVKGIAHLNFFELLIILSLLFIGGIERNPGPSSSSSDDSISLLSATEHIIEDKFSIVHYNVHSIANKMDLIQSELCNFDVICITESWLDDRNSDDDIKLKTFNCLEETGQVTIMVEFVFMFVITFFFQKRKHDLELPNIECLWVEISIKNKIQLIVTFYRPPNSTNAILSSIKSSIGLAFDTNISNILITGDFNLDILKDNSSRKVRDLCQQFNFEQINNEPTHFTENSSSLIDLIITSNRNTILLSSVGKPFLEQNIRYHCPVFCVLTFSKPVKTF